MGRGGQWGEGDNSQREVPMVTQRCQRRHEGANSDMEVTTRTRYQWCQGDADSDMEVPRVTGRCQW